MTVDSVDLGVENILTLSEWLESEEAGKLQKHLEEKILNMLFSQDPSSPALEIQCYTEQKDILKTLLDQRQ